MTKSEINLRLQDKSLYGIYWQAENPIAIVVLVHGFGEHIAWFEEVAIHINNKNISVIGVDLIGHGKSEGKRGVINSFDDFFECIDVVLKYLDKEDNDLPRVLYGHSMGGNIIVNYLLHHPENNFCCALATSPWFKLSMQPTWIQLFLAKTMNVIYPSFVQTAKLDPEEISSVKAVQERYTSDPLIHEMISARIYNEIYKYGLEAIDNASRLSIPLLVAHGDADGITSHLASEEFVSNAPNATLKLWPGLKHETHYEHNKDEVVDFYVDWVVQHIDNA
ncbi:MAG: lysophospholipase [Bacteroidota bacterium]